MLLSSVCFSVGNIHGTMATDFITQSVVCSFQSWNAKTKCIKIHDDIRSYIRNEKLTGVGEGIKVLFPVEASEVRLTKTIKPPLAVVTFSTSRGKERVLM